MNIISDSKSENNIRKKYLLKLLTIFILLKVGYLVTPLFYEKHGSEINSSILCKNDCGWYQKIAENGYEIFATDTMISKFESLEYQSEWAFFPLYPLINATIMSIFDLTFSNAAFISSFFLSFFLFWLYYNFSFLWFKSNRVAFYNTLLIMIFPFHFYFSMYYTEALFLLLSIIGFGAIFSRKYIFLIPVLLLLPLLRVNGLLCAAFMALYYLEHENLLGLFKIRNLKLIHLKILSLFSLSIFSFVVWCYFNYLETGDYFTFQKAQLAWDRKFIFPLFTLFNNGNWAYQFLSIYVLLMLIFLVKNYNKMPLTWWLMCLTTLLLPLSAGSVLSMHRYASVLFPMFFILGKWTSEISVIKQRVLFILLGVLHLISFQFYINSHHLSY